MLPTFDALVHSRINYTRIWAAEWYSGQSSRLLNLHFFWLWIESFEIHSSIFINFKNSSLNMFFHFNYDTILKRTTSNFRKTFKTNFSMYLVCLNFNKGKHATFTLFILSSVLILLKTSYKSLQLININYHEKNQKQLF